MPALPASALWALPLLVAPLLVSRAPESAPHQDDHAEARTLFIANCASCHGEKGDGEGTTDLDRKARSFKDGGFSFGNTPEALFRTLTTGIPGTPMPGFESALTDDQRRLLADYVVTLGPPPTEVDTERTELHVVDRPQFVRGMLPSISGTTAPTVRGLMLGLPSGQSFEYRTDDVRLLGVRQGGFVRRLDWTGRGGSELEPLGKVVLVIDEGQPESTFKSADGKALETRFRGTWVEADRAGLAYELLDAEGRVIANVRESIKSLGTTVGSGYTRRFDLYPTAESTIRFRAPFWSNREAEGYRLESFRELITIPGTGNRKYAAAPRNDGMFDCRIAPWQDTAPRSESESLPGETYHLKPGTGVRLEELRLITSDISEETKLVLHMLANEHYGRTFETGEQEDK